MAKQGTLKGREVRVTLRISPLVYAGVKQICEWTRSSVNVQIVRMLEHSYASKNPDDLQALAWNEIMEGDLEPFPLRLPGFLNQALMADNQRLQQSNNTIINARLHLEIKRFHRYSQLSAYRAMSAHLPPEVMVKLVLDATNAGMSTIAYAASLITAIYSQETSHKSPIS